MRFSLVNDKSKILIIEDDPDVAEMLNAFFRGQGFDVAISNWGEEGILNVTTNRPDLIILDIRLPDIDGYEVARRLRADRKSSNIPIIFLTEKRDRADRLQGLEIGADDYITKPFDVQELKLRVRNAIRRAEMGTLTNPITGLSEGDIVLEQIKEALKSDNWAFLLISISHIDYFREKYGFVASDDVIRAVSLMINNFLNEFITKDGFLGHFSSNEFILIANLDTVFSLEEHINVRLKQALEYFYPVIDRELISNSNERIMVNTIVLSIRDGKLKTIDEVKTELKKRKERE